MEPPTHHPSSRKKARVARLASCGTPHWRIAEKLKISEPTLRVHYAVELREGRALTVADLGHGLVELAKGKVEGSTPRDMLEAAKFYLSRHGRDLGYGDEAPTPPPTFNLDRLDAEERVLMQRLVAKMRGGALTSGVAAGTPLGSDDDGQLRDPKR